MADKERYGKWHAVAARVTGDVGLGINDDSALPKGTVDPAYEAKARVLNRAIQDIRMGWYQWQLFIVVGFGWALDNLWPIVISLIFTPIINECSPTRPSLLIPAQGIGLLFGTIFCDSAVTSLTGSGLSTLVLV